MNEKLFTFPAQVFPEISGLFRESRVVFQEVKEAVPVASKKPEEEKKISLADALTKTKNTLLALKTEVDKKDGENKTVDGIEKTIDTDAEKEKLRAFISSHKALDNLMGKISEDKKEESLNAYQNYFETRDVGSIENMTQIEAVHEQIVSLIEGDVKYVEAVKSTEKVGAVNKSAAVIFLEKLPESFKTLTDVKTQSEIVDDSIKILNITETFKEPLTKESSYSSGALVDNIYSKIIQSENYNEEIKERFKDDENKIEFKKWIANSITKKIDKLGSEKKDEKLYVSISFEDKITIKTQEEVDQEKKQEEALKKKEKGDVLTDPEAISAAMQEVKKAKIEFKNKFTGLGSMIAWIFNKFLGIDIKDPLASGGLVSIGRMIAGVESPENADKYDITKNATLRSKFLTAKDIQKISIASVITPQAMQSIFSRKNIFSSEKVKKSVEKNWKVGGVNGTGQKSKNLMGDVLRKFPNTEINKSSKNSVTFNFKNTRDIVQASALLQRQPSSMEMLNSIADGASEKVSGLLGGLDLNVSDMIDDPEENNPVIGNILDIQKAIGYPDITSVSQNGNKLTVSWDSTMADKIVDKVTGIVGKDKKSSTVPSSVGVGSTTVLDKTK